MWMLWQDKLTDSSNVQVSPDDRGYVFGDGVYEVFRVYEERFFEMEAHLERLVKSAQGTRIELPYAPEELARRLEELRARQGTSEGTVYLQITRGVASRAHPFPHGAKPVLMAYCKDVKRPVEQMRLGVQAITKEDIRWLHCDLKTLNLLPNVLAKQEALDRGADEVILHRSGTVTECSASNVMLVKDGVLRTHPANNLILHGITRAVVLRLAREAGLPILEQAFTLNELESADELFLTGTTVEITPIVSVDGRPVGGGEPGQITRKLQEVFEQAIGV